MNSEEIREQTKQMVAYLLDSERTKDDEVIEGYTDNFMLAFEEHQSDNKKELHELLAKWSKRSLEYRGIAARRTTSGENATKSNGRSYGTDDCWKELNELLPDPKDLNWFEKLPLHWKLASHLITGILVGLSIAWIF